jgi:hypothetical protein
MTANEPELKGAMGVAAVLRFLLELAGIAALAVWGIRTGSDDVSSAVLALGAAGLLIVLWAIIVAPKARNPLTPHVRWLIGSGLLLVAAAALWSVGLSIAAVLFAVLNVVDTIAMLTLDRAASSGSGSGSGSVGPT